MKSKDLKLLRKKLEKASKASFQLPIEGPADGKENAAANTTNGVTLQYWNPEQVAKNKNRLQDLLDLFEANMGDQYRNSSWGLDMDAKKTELTHSKARFLVFLDKTTTSGKEEMVGFCHYRFEYDDEEAPTTAVLYVYELQMKESHRSQGLGKQAMLRLEALAQSMEVATIMLTVFRSNQKAMDFYLTKLQYDIADISPSQHNEVADYEILSKAWKK